MSLLAISSAIALRMSVDCCIEYTEIINKIIHMQLEKKKHKFVKQWGTQKVLDEGNEGVGKI